MAPKNRRRGSAQAGKQNGGSGGNGNGNGNGKGRGRGRGRGRGGGGGRASSAVLDLTPQNAAAAGPGPFGMGMGMGAGMMGMSPMGSMPFGQQNSAFGYGLGGAGKNDHTVTVKLSLEGAARARNMEQNATLGMWQKQMAVQSGTPLDQHPQWDAMHSMYVPLQNTQPQHNANPLQLHTSSTFVGSMQQQGVVPPPAGDDGLYDFGEGEDEDEADDAHDQLMAVQKRQECVESFMRTQITSYLNDSRYVNDASGAYTACMTAATVHADLSTPSRDQLLFQRGITDQVTTTLEGRLADFQRAIVAQIQGAQHIAAPPLGGQKQMAVQSGTPLNQHPQWDAMHSMYVPLQNTQPQHNANPLQLHTSSTFVGSMQQQGVVPPPAGDDGLYDFGEGEDEDEADDAHDQLMAVQKRQECVESFMRTQITSYLNDSRYVNDASGAYTACMTAATVHADLSTPSRDQLLFQRGITDQVTTTLEGRLADFQRAIVAQIQGAQHIAAPPLGGHPGPGKGTDQAQAHGNTLALALTCGGGGDIDQQSLGDMEPSSQSEAESFGLGDVLHLVSKEAPVPSGGSEDNMLSPNSGMSMGADVRVSATKSPHKKAKSGHVAHPLNVLRAALMHVPATAGTQAIQGIPKDFGVRTQALCDTIAGLIKKVHSISEFETLLEDFKIFEKRSQGTPSTYECRVSHILYILTRGMAADPTAKCSVSFSDFVAVPTVTPVARKMPGATPCPRPGCKCTDKLVRRNKYCCGTCAKGVPCTVDQHFTTEVVEAEPTPSSARGARRGRPRKAS